MPVVVSGDKAFYGKPLLYHLTVSVDDAVKSPFWDEAQRLWVNDLDDGEGKLAVICPLDGYLEVLSVAWWTRSGVTEPLDMIALIHPNMIKLCVVVKHQGNSMLVAQVKSVDLFKVDTGAYVAIDNEEGLIIPEIFNVFDCTPRTEDSWLVASHNRDGIGLSFDKLINHIGNMVGGYDDSFTSHGMKLANQDINQRAIKNRKKGFWSLFGQRQQAGAEAGCQYHCFHEGNGASMGRRCQGIDGLVSK